MNFTSWSPSRFADYEQCPMLALHKHLLKTCPNCFKGKLFGGGDDPVICDTCGEEQKKGAALVRGDIIGKEVDAYLAGKAKAPPSSVRHEKVLAMMKDVRAALKKKTAKIQLQIAVTKEWKLAKWFGKDAWGRFILDAILMPKKSEARIIDWKTGGINKKTGAVWADAKYDDQLFAYSTAVLSTLGFDKAEAALVFLDCGPRFDPVIERPTGTLTQIGLPKAHAEWAKKLRPMLSDEVFAPRPSPKCNWCDYRKEVGGPCPH